MANSADMSRLEAFLQRADKLGYFSGEYTISSLCEHADQQSFMSLKRKSNHPLHRLFPPERSAPYNTRPDHTVTTFLLNHFRWPL